MKILIWIIIIVAAIAGVFFVFNNYIYQEKESEIVMPELTPPVVKIIPIEHASAIISWAGSAIYIDPVGSTTDYAGQPPASFVLVTDIHGDHFSTSTLEGVSGSVMLIVPQAVKDMLSAELGARAVVLGNGSSTTEGGFSITAVPMYNLPDAENSSFHAKGRGNGYLVERDGIRVYIAGDTAGTPEMRALRDIDIALVPMNLPYTMSVEEAAEAVLSFAPAQVYPYHYRGQDGLADVERFKQLVNLENPAIEVVLLNWYP